VVTLILAATCIFILLVFSLCCLQVTKEEEKRRKERRLVVVGISLHVSFYSSFVIFPFIHSKIVIILLFSEFCKDIVSCVDD
jgi:hypothetical protein